MNNSYYILATIINAALAFIMLPFMTWVLDSHDVARYSLLILTINTSFTVFSLAYDQVYTREYFNLANKKSILLSCLMPCCFLLFLFILITNLIGLRFDESIFGIDDKEILYKILLCVFFWVVLNYLNIFFKMENSGIRFLFSSSSSKIIFFILFSISTFINKKIEFIHIVNLYLMALAVSCVFSFFMFLFLNKNEKIEVDFSFLKINLKSSMILNIGALSYIALFVLDRFFLKLKSSLDDVALYSVALGFASSIAILQVCVSTIWSPIFFRWESENTIDKNYNESINVVRGVASLFFVLLGIASCFVNYLIHPKFYLAKSIIPLCGLVYIYYMLSEIFISGLYLKRKYLQSSLILFSITAVLFFILKFSILNLNYISLSFLMNMVFFALLVARLEFSNIQLKVKNRIYIYIEMILLLMVSVFHFNFIEDNLILVVIVWMMLLVSFFAFYKKMYLNLIKKIINR